MGINLDVEIVFPNIVPTLEDDKEYIQVSHLFGDTERACLGSDGKFLTNGIFQIDVFTPQNTGRSQILDEIANHFPTDKTIEQDSVKLRIISTDMNQPIYDRNFYRQPLSVNWQVFTKARTL